MFLRTIADLVRAAQLDAAFTQPNLTLAKVAATLNESGRPAVLSLLKSSGVEKLGDRQKARAHMRINAMRFMVSFRIAPDVSWSMLSPKPNARATSHPFWMRCLQ